MSDQEADGAACPTRGQTERRVRPGGRRSGVSDRGADGAACPTGGQTERRSVAAHCAILWRVLVEGGGAVGGLCGQSDELAGWTEERQLPTLSGPLASKCKVP